MNRNIKRYNPGTTPLSAEDLNKRASWVDWFSKLTVKAPLKLSKTAGGPVLSLRDRSGMWIQITGSTAGAYAWKEVLPQGGGTWADGELDGTATNWPAYEVNGRTVATGQKVWAERPNTSSNELRFKYN
jgi:hypothetical protein